MVEKKLDHCVLCGGNIEISTAPTAVVIKGRTITVDGFEYEKCIKCGEEYYAQGVAGAIQKKAVTQYKYQNNLLTGKEIKAIRKNFGLTQIELEDLLGIGHKTVVRWEADTVFQSPLADKMLRLVRDYPAVFGLDQSASANTSHPAAI